VAAAGGGLACCLFAVPAAAVAQQRERAVLHGRSSQNPVAAAGPVAALAWTAGVQLRSEAAQCAVAAVAVSYQDPVS
jgi:hypothetical protein